MAGDYCRKSGQIPAFGDWENANELPLTQYFECARQAGLLRCSCSGECGGSSGDLYGVGFPKPLPRRVHAAPQWKTSRTSMESRHPKEHNRKQVKMRDLMMDQPTNQPSSQNNKYVNHSKKTANLTSRQSSVKIDEDLYKIPSELLENSKRKKMLGFFSRCMISPCAA